MYAYIISPVLENSLGCVDSLLSVAIVMYEGGELVFSMKVLLISSTGDGVDKSASYVVCGVEAKRTEIKSIELILTNALV